jgi:hypothetical protein
MPDGMGTLLKRVEMTWKLDFGVGRELEAEARRGIVEG